jgi:hypothetical protein
MGDLAGDTSLGTLVPIQLQAGEAPIVTDGFTAATGISFEKYEVFALDATGKAIKFDPTELTDPDKIAVGIAAQATTASGTKFPAFVGGCFNHEALVWPVAFTTYELRRLAFIGTDIHISKVI